MKGGGSEWEGGYEGAEAFGEGHFWILGEGSIILILGTVFFWSGVWVDCHRGASVAGSFGLGGQESLWNPGAREPERLCS
jgi:hypothetical protein